MRKRLLLVVALLFGVALHAQNTTVSATVQDQAGQTWNNGSYTITFVPVNGIPGPYTNNGSPISLIPYTGTLSSGGVFSVAIPDNTKTFPLGSQWQFTFCPTASTGCSTYTTPVSGTTDNISAGVTAALAGITINPSLIQTAYADAEVVNPINGALYFNVATGLREYNAGAWAAVGSGGSPVTSVFGRTGAVVATAGDYSGIYMPVTGGNFTGGINYPYVNQGGLCTNGILSYGLCWGQPSNSGISQLAMMFTTGVYAQPFTIGSGNVYIGNGTYLSFSTGGYNGQANSSNGSFYAAAGVIDANVAGSDTHDATLRMGVSTVGSASRTTTAGVPSANCTVGSIDTNSSASSASTVLYVCYPANTWNAVTVP